MGLNNSFDDDAFVAVMAGVDPSSGVELGRPFVEKSVRGYDLTFSAPKSVSLLAAVADPVVTGGRCTRLCAGTPITVNGWLGCLAEGSTAAEMAAPNRRARSPSCCGPRRADRTAQRQQRLAGVPGLAQSLSCPGCPCPKVSDAITSDRPQPGSSSRTGHTVIGDESPAMFEAMRLFK